MGITGFSYSNGWLSRFKMRHGISSQIISGESAGVDPQLISDDRITIALCCSADGSEKLKPFVIGKAGNPRCFKNFNVGLYCDYVHNKKAWMTSVIFSDCLQKFNSKMRRQNREVLLIMDNAPSHIIPTLSNVKIHFLPPTTTSHLQPLDSGIIQSFKKHYSKQQLSHLIKCIDRRETPSLFLDSAIRYVKIAWDSVTSETIINCWAHSGLIKKPEGITESDDSTQGTSKLENMLQRVQEDLDMDPDMRLTIRQFIDSDRDANPTEVLTDSEILETVKKPTSESESEDSDNEPKNIYIPSMSEAKTGIDNVLKFLEHDERTTEQEINKCLREPGCGSWIVAKDREESSYMGANVLSHTRTTFMKKGSLNCVNLSEALKAATGESKKMTQYMHVDAGYSQRVSNEHYFSCDCVK
ncbi:tigger transposable element-derived protein 6-like [Saccostrea echinata]|uniref:tigger transposable element-derived protein 6-like n=1 Tax=Saccostrea echinata TaxID=191078 RepID=UPI002A829188|nr:tigger transposable element-derived protein 6-like [Saccostrea echinata]